MPMPYISRPKGNPEKDCIVYPLSPATGAEAYMLYATASGADKWKELYAKIEAESDAFKGARGVYPFIILADELEEYRRRNYPASDIEDEHELNQLRKQYKENERERSSFFEFIGKLGQMIRSSIVYPEGIEPIGIPEHMCENLHVISDKSIGDKVIVMINILPINLSLLD